MGRRLGSITQRRLARVGILPADYARLSSAGLLAISGGCYALWPGLLGCGSKLAGRNADTCLAHLS